MSEYTDEHTGGSGLSDTLLPRIPTNDQQKMVYLYQIRLTTLRAPVSLELFLLKHLLTIDRGWLNSIAYTCQRCQRWHAIEQHLRTCRQRV